MCASFLSGGVFLLLGGAAGCFHGGRLTLHPAGGRGAPFLHLEQLLSLHGGCAVVPRRKEGGSPTGDQDVGLKGGEVQDGPTVDLDDLGQ